jgi:hypothetical protein
MPSRKFNRYGIHQRQLTKSQTEEVLLACTDTRELGEATDRPPWLYATSVYEVAWNLLDQQFRLSNEVVLLVIRFLGDGDARICAAAALLLKNNSKCIPEQLRKEAAQKVLNILQDDELSRRPLDRPYYRISWLDDVLFETLKVLGE